MNLTQKEYDSELTYLKNTLEATNSEIKEKESKQVETKRAIVSSKRHLWQNKNEYSSVETFATMDEEDLNTGIINENQNKITKLYRSLYSPYFGKVTFATDDIIDVYIGLTGIEHNGKNYVYDWRAPIANLYYNYEIGPSEYTTPKGVIKGKNTNKRQFKIESGKLVEAFNTDVTTTDELLQAALLSNNTDKMKNIVSTIQKEQNEIIRYAKAKDLIIEGVAGSGKTSVAMHRVAYLLYNNKELTNKNVLIISPSTVFTNYISNILPDLGEEEAPTITVEAFIKKYIRDNIDLNYNGDKDKYDKEFIDILNKRLLDYYNNLRFKSKIGIKKKFITSEELNTIFKKKNNLASISDRIDYLVSKICDLYDISYEKNGIKLKENIYKMLEIPSDPISLYEKVMGELPTDLISYICAVYIYFEINGYPALAHIKHVIIDEVQDYPLLLLKLFKKVFSSAQFTLLGDIHQSINECFKYESLMDLKEIFNSAEYIELNKTYRSSYEIIEYTNKILGLTGISSIRKKIGIPVLEKTGTISDAKKELDRISKKYSRVALIVRNSDVAECISLFDDKDISLISVNSLKPKLIVPIDSIKGLEFDAVVIYTKQEEAFNKNEKNLFYVAATRAVHELIVFNNN